MAGEIGVGQLTNECFIIQSFGLTCCSTCVNLNTINCTGKEILKTGKNEKGYGVNKDGLQISPEAPTSPWAGVPEPQKRKKQVLLMAQ